MRRGNYIVIKHHEQEYSEICHLLKDSITVKEGDSVKGRQVIAKCGNSGNTSEPHIHFQIQRGQSFYLSPGLPIFFQNIQVIGNEKEKFMHIWKGVKVKNISR